MSSAKRKLEERRERRDRLARIATVILLLAGAGVAYFVFDPLGSSSGPDADSEGGASSLVFADFDGVKDLHHLDLDSREDVIVTALPKSGNTIASQSSSWLVIQVEEEDEGRRKPTQYLFDPDAGITVDLGILVEPEFSPDGQRLAGLRPVDDSLCRPTRCGGDKVVVVVDLDDPENESELSEPGRFILRGWAGNHLLVSNNPGQGDPILQSISPAGDVADLPFPPGDLWGASPDGNYVIESGDGGTRFHEFSAGRVVDDAGEIGIPAGSVLEDGVWSHDSSLVVSFAVDDAGELVLVSFGPTDLEPEILADGGESSTGTIMWAPENDAVAITRFNGTELEAVYCMVNEPDSCEVLFAWTRGISLLRLE